MRVVKDKEFGFVSVYDLRPEAVEIIAQINNDEIDGWRYQIEAFRGGYAIRVYDAEGFVLGFL